MDLVIPRSELVLGGPSIVVPDARMIINLMGLGKRVAKELLNHHFGKTPDTTPAGVLWVSAHTASPGIDGQGAGEVSGGGYARVSRIATDWNAATDADPSVVTNATIITFNKATASWGTISHLGLWKSSGGTTEADFCGFYVLSSSKVIGTDDTLTIPATNASFNINPE